MVAPPSRAGPAAGSGLRRLSRLARSLDPRNETVAAVLCFAGAAAIKLVSSIVLTRLLYPEAYGIIGMIVVVMFVIEMASDMGLVPLVIRHARGKDPAFLHTLWSVRLVRNLLSGSLLFFAAPAIARLYETPELATALQIFCIYYALKSFESMSFMVLFREQRSRVVNYLELLSAFLSMLFVIAFSYFRRDHYGMVYGMLVAQLLTTLFSYLVPERVLPRLRFERAALGELLGWAKYIAPSSYITIGVMQYDRMVFLKFFDLTQLGLYSLAAGLSGPVESLVTKLSQQVLYPRFTEYMRSTPERVRQRVYQENRKTILVMLALPVLIGGGAEIIVRILFDPRYVAAGFIAQMLCVRALLLAFYVPTEDLLLARGVARAVLVGNLLRLAWLVAGSTVGYALCGFTGFLVAIALDVVPALLYGWWQRHGLGLLDLRQELARLSAAGGGFAIVAILSHQLIELYGS